MPAVVNKGRELSAKKSTFNLDDGVYNATITNAFWYKTKDKLDRVMLVFELADGAVFKYSVSDEWIEEYPLSVIISQAPISYVTDFVGLVYWHDEIYTNDMTKTTDTSTVLE